MCQLNDARTVPGLWPNTTICPDTPWHQALRLSCKNFKTACDSKRSSISFNIRELYRVGPYLPKVLGVTTAVIKYSANELNPDARPNLRELAFALPHLTTLKLEYHSASIRGWRSISTWDFAPWRKTMHTLDLSSIALTGDDVGLQRFSHLPHLQCLSLQNIMAVACSEDIAGCSSLHRLILIVNCTAPTLDLSPCVHLVSLCIRQCNLRTLNVSGMKSLRHLYCNLNVLTELIFSECSSLETMDCSNNVLNSLDITYCQRILELRCYNNPMQTLIVAGCSTLLKLLCCGHQSSHLHLSGCTALEVLGCNGSSVETMSLEDCINMQVLCLDNSYKLSGLNLARMEQLTEISVQGCRLLTSLDIARCTSLIRLSCGDCPLITTLATQTCPALSELSIHGCSIVDIRLDGCPRLKWLDCNKCPVRNLF